MKNAMTWAMLLMSLTCSAQNKTAAESQPWIPFTWESTQSGDRTIEKTAFSIPVKIADLPYEFDAQFDLGAASTMFYGNTIAPYLAEHAALRQAIDTTRKVRIQGVSCAVLKGLPLTFGKIAFPAADIILFSDYGEEMTADSVATPSVKHIGTIAADLFSDGILVIDYPNQRLCRLDRMPESWKNDFCFTAIEYDAEQNWIFLPLKIGDTTRKVLFDTGSSMFPLLSSPTRIASVADMSQCADSLSVGAWGNQVMVYGYKPTRQTAMGEITFESLPVYGSPYLSDEVLEEAGFWGIVGNRYFLGHTILIDYKNKQFGISR